MKILITGAAGFIGGALSIKLIEKFPDASIIGIDNLNDYYDPALKIARLQRLGIENNNCNDRKCIVENWPYNQTTSSTIYSNYSFIRLNLEDTEAIDNLFRITQFDFVINLAAQAGVRYSIENPHAYIKSNIDGFINILEGCRQYKVKHLLYASSSSVYGLNGKTPFNENDGIAHPVSLYAATKKANELMAHAYSQLYDLPTTGLRFFTVYGPWGRPDMSPYLFIDAILHDKEIKVFNNGNMLRDFTYVDDVVECISRLLLKIPQRSSDWDNTAADPSYSSAPYRIYNIGNSNPINLKDYIETIEEVAQKKAIKRFLPMQPGDVYQTYADSSSIAKATGFKPSTSLKDGITKTVEWFRNYSV